MMSSLDIQSHTLNKLTTKNLKQKANEFLNSRKCASNLIDIIQSLEISLNNGTSVTARILTLEHIFTEILKRNEMVIKVEPLKPKDESPEVQYREWLQLRYKESLRLILNSFNHVKDIESTQAMVTAMKLLILEGCYPVEATLDINYFPLNRLRNILIKMLSSDKRNNHLFDRFKEYTNYKDILFYTWKLIISLTPKGLVPNEIFIQNFLNLINASSTIITNNDNNDDEDEVNNITSGSIIIQDPNWKYDYSLIRKYLNKTWSCIILWKHNEQTHRQLLILLLEKIINHLDKPLLLTDFLMESLDVGGPISLLALQGIFILIQHHNLTYPDIYEKLYSMFEPEIFHTKFKARLFYLADIFLSSSHLPENLVAAFVKRLSRLSLVAPPQDIIIILYFIGNLMLRHPGLKSLISHPNGGQVPRDPYIMDERKPNESKAIESSLWEIAALQNHCLPSIATAAKFISNPLPTIEWDLSSVLEINENDIFDQELVKRVKGYPLNFEKPQSMFLQKDDKIKQYWKLF